MALAGVLRNSIRPLSARCFLRLSPPLSEKVFAPFPVAPTSGVRPAFLSDVRWGLSLERFFSTSTAGAVFNSLTDNRFTKRRPGTKPRRKRSSLRPSALDLNPFTSLIAFFLKPCLSLLSKDHDLLHIGPYAWVQYVPGEPIPGGRPNGSVQGREQKKRIKQRKAFILSEKRKCKAQRTEARKKGDMKRIERKMAAVAREKAWAQRLIELQQLGGAKKATMGVTITRIWSLTLTRDEER